MAGTKNRKQEKTVIPPPERGKTLKAETEESRRRQAYEPVCGGLSLNIFKVK